MEKAHVFRREPFKAVLQEMLHAKMHLSSSSAPLSGSCPTTAQQQPPRAEGAGERRGLLIAGTTKGGLPLLERKDTGGAVQLLYNAPEARAPRWLTYSSKPMHLLLQKSPWLLSSPKLSVLHSWSDPLPSHSTRLNQQIKAALMVV